MASLKDCLVLWQGRVPYPDALDLQMRICEAKKRGFELDVLLLLEHPPTITLGRHGNPKHLLANEDQLRNRGIGIWNVDRGGDITYHGPGQLVGYPILQLDPGERDVHGYMQKLEESLIGLIAAYGIEGSRVAGLTGVWTKEGKIAALGVHFSRWITRHGFALNVNTDLSSFDLIVPCGIIGKGVTSMQKFLSRQLDLQEVAARYVQEFGLLFSRNMIWTSGNALRDKLQAVAHARGAPSDA